MTASTIDSILPSQPQVEFLVNRQLVAGINLRFHAFGMKTPLGIVITKALEDQEQTQAWLAEQVGVSEQAVSKWLRTGKISRVNAGKVADALNMSLTQLLDKHPAPEADERWHSFPVSLKQRVLALVDEITKKRAG